MKKIIKFSILFFLITFLVFKVIHVLGVFTSIKYDIEETNINNYNLKFIYNLADIIVFDIISLGILSVVIITLLFTKIKNVL